MITITYKLGQKSKMCVCVCTRVLGFVWRGYEGASAGPGRSLVLCSKDDAGAHAHSLNRVD